ncbi:DUF3987 domain-containing protein [uncultured Helicobacter sp.]|uniref:DUF3987 domain-containing protein n=1 Tax=uncultured Helicobacter sp. TaxID=175537 RepID=UPI00374F558F
MQYSKLFLSALMCDSKNFRIYSKRVPLEWLKHDKDLYRIYQEIQNLNSQNLPIEALSFKSAHLQNLAIEIASLTPVPITESLIDEIHRIYKRQEIARLSQALKAEQIDEREFFAQIARLDSKEPTESRTESNSLNLDKISPFLKGLIQNLRLINSYPDSMILSAILTTLGGIIGARAKINNSFGIEVFPVIWSIIIAPSSLSAKSTLFKYTKKLILGDLQNLLYHSFEKDLESYKQNLAKYNALKPQEKQKEKEPQPPRVRRVVFATDSTPEAKIKALHQNQNGGVIFYDEFKAELEKSNENPSYKALKTSMFDGEFYDKELVKEGTILLKHPCVSEIGLITKQWLIEATQKNDIASGFLARYLFSCNARADFAPLQAKEITLKCGEEFAKVSARVLELLEFDCQNPQIFRFDDNAREFYRDWFNDYSKSAFDTESDEELTMSYRLSTYALKIALISFIFNETASGRDFRESRQIPIQYLKEAIEIIALFRAESDKVLSLMSEHQKIHFEIDSVQEKLIKKIKAHPKGEITRSQALNIRGMNASALNELIEQGIIKHHTREKTTYIYL